MKRNTTELTSDELSAEIAKVQTEDISTYPSVFQMGRNLVKQGWLSAVGMAKGQPLLASPEKAAARLEICKTCDYFDAGPQRCKKCGCYMASKANLEHSACPLAKWGELQTIPIATKVEPLPNTTKPLELNLTASLSPYDMISGPSSSYLSRLDGSLLRNFTEYEKIEFLDKYQASVLAGEATHSFKVKNITFTILEYKSQ